MSEYDITTGYLFRQFPDGFDTLRYSTRRILLNLQQATLRRI